MGFPSIFRCCKRKNNVQEQDEEFLLNSEDDPGGAERPGVETTAFGRESFTIFQNLKNEIRAFFSDEKNLKYKKQMIDKACAGNKVLDDFYRDSVIALSAKIEKLGSSPCQSLVVLKECAQFLLDAILMHASKENKKYPNILDHVLACDELIGTINGNANTALGRSLKLDLSGVVEARAREKAPGTYFSHRRNSALKK